MKIQVGLLLRRLIITTNRPTGDVQQANRNKLHNRPQKSRHNHYNARFLMDPEGQLNSMSSSPLSITPEIVSPGKEDYKPPKRKRISSPDVDRSFRHSDDTSDDDISGGSSPVQPRPATPSRTQDGRSHRGNADTSTTSNTGGDGGTQYSSTNRRTGSTNCTLCASPPAARQYCSQACLRGLRYSSKTVIAPKLDAACLNAARHSKTS